MALHIDIQPLSPSVIDTAFLDAKTVEPCISTSCLIKEPRYMFCLVPRHPTPPPTNNPPPPPTIWVGKIHRHFLLWSFYRPPIPSEILAILRIFAHFQACVTRAHAQRIQHYNRITKNKGKNNNISLSLRYVL